MSLRSINTDKPLLCKKFNKNFHTKFIYEFLVSGSTEFQKL